VRFVIPSGVWAAVQDRTYFGEDKLSLWDSMFDLVCLHRLLFGQVLINGALSVRGNYPLQAQKANKT
jgi:hypothetical protein